MSVSYVSIDASELICFMSKRQERKWLLMQFG